LKATLTETAHPVTEDGLLRPREAAAFLGISRAGVYLLLKRGALPYVRVLSGPRIPRRSLVEFAEARLVQREAAR
jgi:excisionase family DNA binding protein